MSTAVAVLPLLWTGLVGLVAWRHRPVRDAVEPARGSLRSHAGRGRPMRRGAPPASPASPPRPDVFTRLGGALRRRPGRMPEPVTDRRTGVAVVAGLLGIVGYGAVGIVGLLLTAMAPLLARAAAARRRADRRTASLDGALEATELLALALRGGSTVGTALGEVAPWLRGPAAEVVEDLLVRRRQGWPLAEELSRHVTLAPPPLRRLLVVLLAAERDGAPVVADLGRLSVELRAEQRRSLEAAARRVPVRLLFPLVAGVLPAVVLLAVVPVLLATLGGVRASP